MCELLTTYDASGDEIFHRVIITKRVFLWLYKIEIYTTDSKSEAFREVNPPNSFRVQKLTKEN